MSNDFYERMFTVGERIYGSEIIIMAMTFCAIMGCIIIVCQKIQYLYHKNDVIICPECGTENGWGNKYCKECGAQFTNERYCSKCGKSNSKDAEFCVRCGNKFKDKK